MRWACLFVAMMMLAGCKSKEEQLREAEEDAKFEVDKKSQIVKGIGEGLKGRGKEGVQALSEGVGEVFKGAATGFDKSLKAVKVSGDDSLAAKGLKVERASHHTGEEKGGSKSKTITAYVVFDQAFKGSLQLRAFADGDSEVGRASTDVEEKAGSAGYVDFEFDERTPVGTAASFKLYAP